jgi:hypothetical protein
MRFCVLTLLAVLLVPAASTMAVTHEVNVNGGAPFESIGEAVAAASDGDTILVWPGTYEGENNREINFGSKNLRLESVSGLAQTIIDCGSAGRALVLSDPAIDYSTVIRGFSFLNGYAWAAPEDGGGAIVCYEASPIIEYCWFQSCQGAFGGGVKLLYSDALIRYSRFVMNTADYGGAVSTSYGSPKVDNVWMWGNHAYTQGGAVRCYDGTPEIYGTTIAWNSDWSRGAAVSLQGGSIDATITRTIIAFSQLGAGLSNGTTGTIEQCIVFGNVGGDALPPYAGDNLFVDPLFCNMETGDLNVCDNSLALGANNAWQVDLGWVSAGCPTCSSPVESATWGSIKGLYR